MRAAFDFAQKIVRATDLQEFMTLQTDFVRTQMAAFQDQTKEFGSAVQSATQSTVGTAIKP